MGSNQESTHVFVVRIWREDREIEGAAPQWRGSIEHVRDGQRRYVKTLSKVIEFIVPYLEAMGVDVTPS